MNVTLPHCSFALETRSFIACSKQPQNIQDCRAGRLPPAWCAGGVCLFAASYSQSSPQPCSISLPLPSILSIFLHLGDPPVRTCPQCWGGVFARRVPSANFVPNVPALAPVYPLPEMNPKADWNQIQTLPDRAHNTEYVSSLCTTNATCVMNRFVPTKVWVNTLHTIVLHSPQRMVVCFWQHNVQASTSSPPPSCVAAELLASAEFQT